ncbi:MAG: 3,4-dihydroxy-2-butanone-4-phosphate synthase [Oceanospirillales bacterium]|uniref:3,4-dihydroxy-2-butanone 4-phosphate synthase n=1 Tax=Marinobacterium halophilum TaxID=267374 RepID=A0A2P8EXG1_9GAMM|nr:bifunctional 3,4-dihydroxy-2-butanone-4-phosphate synthase/GTP cyclohydrolase II [Marinobacterium halophilum]MBR9827205.1 3,4-dihydroxy-2-butanone-4-phosphate synthase [Oceanospirillales bacterium]PSL14152.1 GTP cyclohydrolase II /3,4-dihydroxy-2-butanone 4-phosphate synthase [Marinobacterium halophilum]
MQLNTTEELIEDIRQGKMVILMDDEDRENEGDLVIAAQCVRPEDINFMITHARGLVCLTLSRERCEQLKLPLMVQSNGAAFSTNFTLSIEAAKGVTTGISAADRAVTIHAAVKADAVPEDIVQPGHIFPLMAQPGGVLSRAGHTEAGCDIARMAGFSPSSVIVEIINEDGSMARRPDLEKFAAKHGIKIGTIADLIHYRTLNEHTVERQDEGTLQTEYGDFRYVTFRDEIQGCTHLALMKGDVTPEESTLVRVHIRDEVLRDVVGVRPGDQVKWTMRRALKRVADEGKGVVLLLDSGRRVDLGNAIDNLLNADRSRSKVNVSASGAYLTVGTGSQILRDLGVRKMRLLSSPMKFNAISGFDLEIEEYIPYED